MSDDFIPLSAPNLCGRELEYITDAVQTGWVSTAGPYVSQFEQSVANYVGMQNAVACQSGTAGLHTALMAIGVGGGDVVIVPALTFIAAVNPVKYVGAEPVFMDCDMSLCLDPVKLQNFCQEDCIFAEGALRAKVSNKHVKAIIVVHVFGNAADMESIIETASQYNIKVLEDATEALGTRFDSGKYSGCYAGTIGDLGVFSFNGNKIITSGGGGMIVSSCQDLLLTAKHLTTQAKCDTVYFKHDAIGYNYRLTNLQAALGLAQMEQLEKFIAIKITNYSWYSQLFEDTENVRLLQFRENTRSNHWFYSLLLPDRKTRDRTINNLLKQGIQVRPIWDLINNQPPYIDAYSYKIERAHYYLERVINLPCSTDLDFVSIVRVANAIKQEVEHI